VYTMMSKVGLCRASVQKVPQTMVTRDGLVHVCKDVKSGLVSCQYSESIGRLW
jgi:hypothetical protein